MESSCFLPISGRARALTSITSAIPSPSFVAHGAARPANAGETPSSTTRVHARRRRAGQAWTTGSDKCCVSGITQLEQWICVTPLWAHYSELADDKQQKRLHALPHADLMALFRFVLRGFYYTPRPTYPTSLLCLSTFYNIHSYSQLH